MSNNKNEGYSNIRIVIRKNDFNKLRSNKRFHLILRLTRILNSMRFSWSATVNLSSGDKPADSRDRTASFLYMCALLYESFHNKSIYHKLKNEFFHLQSFQEGLMSLYQDKKRKKYHKTVFYTVRNKIAFHFDSVVIKESIENLKIMDNEVVFLESHSVETGDISFPLSDKLVFNHLMDTSELNKETEDKFKSLLSDVADYSKKFIRASEKLIIDALEEMGYKIEQTQ